MANQIYPANKQSMLMGDGDSAKYAILCSGYAYDPAFEQYSVPPAGFDPAMFVSGGLLQNVTRTSGVVDADDTIMHDIPAGIVCDSVIIGSAGGIGNAMDMIVATSRIMRSGAADDDIFIMHNQAGNTSNVTNILEGHMYFVVNGTASDHQVSHTKGGPPIIFTGTDEGNAGLLYVYSGGALKSHAAYLDTGIGLPTTSNGNDITVVWNNAGIFSW